MLFWRISAMYLFIIGLAACEPSGRQDGEQTPETAAASAAAQELDRIFDWYREFSMREYPEWASYEGDHRFSTKLTDNSAEAIGARYDSLRAMMAALESIAVDDLDESQKLNYNLFHRSVQEQIDDQQFEGYALPLNQQSGIHIEFPQIIEFQPLATAEDYAAYFSRLKEFPAQVDNAISNMRVGIAKKLVQPDFVIEQVIRQVENIRNQPAKDTPFMLPLLDENNGLNDSSRKALSKELRQIVARSIQPAYNKLQHFLSTEYLPHCRKEAGVWALPDGEKRYQRSIRYHTTTAMSADEIFAIGMDEVERIFAEIKAIKEELNFQGDMAAFYAYLRSDPQFYYTDKNELMAEYRRILDVMDTRLPQLFGRLPEAPYALKEMEEYRAASAPQAYYYSAPDDGSRPGYFYVNTYDLPSRPKYTMTALALHEAVPGHHLQIALAKELESVPWFRKHLGFTGFVEGWGLYSEYLGYETEMYTDVYQRLGALTFEIWRACRLVVDAGIHAKKWTREQGVEFMARHTPNSELDIRSEIDRYIVWPGQALAYKIGELKIKELRKRAEDSLGESFDIRAFHDLVLNQGAIPLSMLESKVEDWIRANGAQG